MLAVGAIILGFELICAFVAILMAVDSSLESIVGAFIAVNIFAICTIGASLLIGWGLFKII